MKKYSIKFLLNNICGYNIFEDLIILSKESSQGSLFEFYDNHLNFKKNFEMDTIYGGYKLENLFISFKRLGNLEILNLDTFKKESIVGKFSFIDVKNNKLFFCNLENSCCVTYSFDEHLQTLFKIQNEEFTKYTKFIVGNIGIGYLKDNEIKFLCMQSGNLLWNYNYSIYFNNENTYINDNRVLVSEDRIIFFAYTEDWSNYATFVLDAKTGEVLFTTREMGMKLTENNGLIYQIQRKAIKILNPKTLEIQTINTSEYCDEQAIFLDDHCVFFYQDRLYVSAREQSSDVYNIWVIFDFFNQKFEHREDMFFNPKKKKDEKNKIFINDIQANEKLVAVKCSENLYIFEKEDIE